MSGAAPMASVEDAEGDLGTERKRPPAEGEMVVASHDALFVETPSSQCDACESPLGEANGTGEYDLPGRGAYLWTRAGETRIESVPLCSSCASAIGMTALARWEIEEEEG